MRASDLNDGTLKALLVLILVAANIVLQVAPAPAPAGPPGNPPASRAVLGSVAENFSAPRTKFPQTPGEAQAHPGNPTPSKETHVARR
jgi:hypothetical protein